MSIYKFENFKSSNILHGISTRKFGTMKNEDRSVNKKNVKRLLKFLDLSLKYVFMRQIHGANVAVVSGTEQSLIEDTDGLITNKKNITLGVSAADCLPVLFYDPKNKVVGVAHGGRKGLKAGIIDGILKKLVNKFSINPAELKVGVGPGIETSCYIVEGKPFDLRKLANEQLLRGGVLKENIENIDLCTACNKSLFYSYRRGDSVDRFTAVISLK